ncbi:MAG: hypothetical protein ACRCXT_06125 [Paraclostridium sp.]
MLRSTSQKSNPKAQPRKKTSTKTKVKSKVKEVEVQDEEIVLNDIMDSEDREVEVILNDLVPERDKTKYGIKSNNEKPKKGGLKLNFNFLGGSKKSSSNKTSKPIKNHRNNITKSKEVVKENKEDLKEDEE